MFSVTGGRAPNGAYCVLVVANAQWAVGSDPPAEAVAQGAVVATGGVITSTEVWAGAAAGEYDVLLVDAACGGGGHVVAVDAAGPEAGVVVGELAIPVLSLVGLGFLAVLLALAGTLGLARWQRKVTSLAREARAR